MQAAGSACVLEVVLMQETGGSLCSEQAMVVDLGSLQGGWVKGWTARLSRDKPK